MASPRIMAVTVNIRTACGVEARMRFIIVAVLAGCATDGMLKDISVGHTGCMQEEMNISSADVEFMAGQWIVQCRGRTFLCSQHGHDVACHERI